MTAHVQGHPDAYCPASGAARTSMRGARIECDKQRRRVCHHEGNATSFTRDETGTHRFRCPQNPSRLGLFASGSPKTRQWRSPVPQSEEKPFPKCELPHTPLQIPERCCLRMDRSSSECWSRLKICGVRSSNLFGRCDGGLRTLLGYRAVELLNVDHIGRSQTIADDLAKTPGSGSPAHRVCTGKLWIPIEQSPRSLKSLPLWKA